MCGYRYTYVYSNNNTSDILTRNTTSRNQNINMHFKMLTYFLDIVMLTDSSIFIQFQTKY